MRTFRSEVIAGGAGSEIAEAALVLPIVFMLLLGIYWFGRAFNTLEVINHAAMEAARIACVHPCATCANGAGPLDTGGTNTNLAGTVVAQTLQAASLDPTQIAPIPGEILTSCQSGQSAPACQSPSPGPNMCVYYDVLLSPVTGPCGVYVSFQYPYSFYFPFTSLNNQQLQLKARIQMRVEN
jgi:Flp pilus assembly protein TadG